MLHQRSAAGRQNSVKLSERGTVVWNVLEDVIDQDHVELAIAERKSCDVSLDVDRANLFRATAEKHKYLRLHVRRDVPRLARPKHALDTGFRGEVEHALGRSDEIFDTSAELAVALQRATSGTASPRPRRTAIRLELGEPPAAARTTPAAELRQLHDWMSYDISCGISTIPPVFFGDVTTTDVTRGRWSSRPAPLTAIHGDA